MDVSSIKNELHQLIESTNNEQLLTEVYEKIKMAEQEPDWWNTLNENQKQRIFESEQQYQRGEVVSNEQVMKKVQQWLKR